MGTNFFPTKKRKWPGFCERKLRTVNGEETEYYYRMVACNLLNTQIDLPLDIEPILAGENEVVAAKRIVQRLCDSYTRFFDVVVADALYMEGPFVNFCLGRGKDVIIVLKNNYPSLIEDAQGLFSRMEPEIWHINGRTIQVWDLDGFTADTIDVPLRVLHTIETYTEKVEENGQIIERKVTKSWWWATTIPQPRLRTKHLWKIGRSRWQIENNIFNSLSQHWSLNHCYKHDPVAIVNFVLMLFIVFTLAQCFYKRNLKPQMRKMINSLTSLTNQLYASLCVGVSKPVVRPSGAGPP
ncbi:MAG: transposase [Planctomycetota bacterium]